MRTASMLILLVAVTAVTATAMFPLISPKSTSPCASCHASMFYQFLDILEGNEKEAIPTIINGTEVLNVTVVIANSCNAGAEGDEHMLHEVSATLSSHNRSFRVVNPTCWIGDMEPGRVNATWQIYAARVGQDELIINAQAVNTHCGIQYADEYSPAPSIKVNYTLPNKPPAISLGGQAGAVLGGGSPCRVCWTSEDEEKEYCRVSLSYSTDDFVSSNVSIASLIPDTGSFDWVLPGIDSTSFRLRAEINDSDGAAGSSIGPVFSVDSTPPGIASVTPAGGNGNVTEAAPISIEFTEPVEPVPAEPLFSITPRAFDLEWSWSPDGKLVTARHYPFEPGTTYTCTVGPGLKDVAMPANLNLTTYSWDFTVPPTAYPAPTISLLSPAGGERYYQDDSIFVNWTATGGTGPLRVNVSLTENSAAAPFRTVARGIPAGAGLVLPAPAVVSDACAVKVTVYDANGLEASSFGPRQFSIARSPDLAASFEEAGTFSENDTINISWKASGGHGNATVSVRFQSDGGRMVIAAGRPLNGSLEWRVPRMDATRGFIAVNVTDDWGAVAERVSQNISLRPSMQLPLPLQNRPPSVSFVVEQMRIIQRRSATFNANGSYDPDGDGLKFTWSFGDGSDPVSTNDSTMIHVYLNRGIFNVVLNVSDGRNATTRSMQVTVDKATDVPGGGPGDWLPFALVAVVLTVGMVLTVYAVVAGRRKGSGGPASQGHSPKEAEQESEQGPPGCG